MIDETITDNYPKDEEQDSTTGSYIVACST